MPKTKPAAAPKPDLLLSALWILGIAGFWLVPDQKIIRAKLLTVQAAVLFVAARLIWRGKGGRSALDAPVVALALSGALFWALSPEHAASESEMTRIFFCAMTFWAASRSFAVNAAEVFASVWTAGACAAAIWAAYQAFGGQTRPFASFGNPIFLGTAMAASAPIALAGVIRGDRARPLWIAALVIEAAALGLTRSRAAAFGLLAGLAVWALARLEGRRRWQALGAAAAAAAAVTWLVWGREWTHGLIWRDAFALWQTKPWLGCGLGRFHLEFPGFASPELRARWPSGAVIINFAHNEYLQTLVETGPLGLGALLAVPVAAWLTLRHETETTRGACTAGALALFAAAFVSPDLRFGASAFAAFVLLGAAVRVEERPAIVPGALSACALAACAWLAARPALAVRRNAAEAPFHVGADAGRMAELEDRLKRAPNDADTEEEIGYLKAKASDFAGASAAFRRAAELAPSRPGPLNNLGNLAYLSGDADGAIDWWEKSLKVAPEQIDARLNLAKLLCERGRLKPCAEQLQEVLKRDPSNAKAQVWYKKMVE